MSYEKHRQKLLNKYPAIEDLMWKAKKRIPKVSWAYLQTGTGREELLQKNLDAFKSVTFKPQFCLGAMNPKIETELFGQQLSAPFGIAPIGLTGLMWPRAEVIFAKAAKKHAIPMCLSTLATETPETVGPHVGDMGWFQLYPPNDKAMRSKLLERAKKAGFQKLVITIDIPTPSRRERTKRAGLRTPPKITPGFIWQGITHPQWSFNTLKNGLPRLRTIEAYSEFNSMMSVGAYVKDQMGVNLTWDYCEEVINEWDGPVLIKGIMHPKDAEMAIEIGAAGIIISNHGGRQFDGAPSALEMLPEIVSVAKGETAILFDSGVRSGLDILRALSLGAEFVLLGRAFLYGVAALGKNGAEHVIEILKSDLKNNMSQIGIENLNEVVRSQR